MVVLIAICVLGLVLGVSGIVMRDSRFRPLLWVASALLSCLGGVVWSGGGMGEGFSPGGMAAFCAAAFWPLAGCVIGEVVKWNTRRRPQR